MTLYFFFIIEHLDDLKILMMTLERFVVSFFISLFILSLYRSVYFMSDYVTSSYLKPYSGVKLRTEMVNRIYQRRSVQRLERINGVDILPILFSNKKVGVQVQHSWSLN